MARKTGGLLNDSTGKVERGRMPKGSLEEPTVIIDGPMRIFRKRGR